MTCLVAGFRQASNHFFTFSVGWLCKVIEAARGAVSQVTLQVQQQFLAEPAGHGGDAEGMLSLQYLRHPAETD
jgi:hypothetical protein